MPTLSEYRAFIGRELGEFIESTAGVGSTTLVLLDDKWPVKSTLDQATLYVDRFLLRPNAVTVTDRLRIIKTYAPQSGSLEPDTPWAIAPATSEAYSIFNVVDPSEIDRAINDTLKRCLVVDELVATPTTGATRHALGTVGSWIASTSAVRQVGRIPGGADRNTMDPFTSWPMRGTIENDGETVYLSHPGQTFGATDLVFIKVAKPSYYHCRAAGGIWGSQSGLALDSDQALPDIKWVAMGALSEIWRRHSQLLEAGANDRLKTSLLDAEASFARLTDEYYTSIEPKNTFRRQVTMRVGPFRSGRGYGW